MNKWEINKILNKLDTLEKLLLSLFFILIPSQLGKHFWPKSAFIYGVRVDYLSPIVYFNDIILIAIFSILVIKTLLRSTNLRAIYKTLVDRFTLKKNIYLIALLTFVIFNILLATRPEIAFYNWLRVLQQVLLFIYLIKLENKRLSKSLRLILIPLFYSSLLAIIQFAKKSSVGGLLYWLGERRFSIQTPALAKISFFGNFNLRPYATFSHPNALAGFLLVLIIIFAIKPESRKVYTVLNSIKKNTFQVITVVFAVIALIITFSQAAWLASVAIILLSLRKLKNTRIPLIIALSIFSLLILLVPIEKQSIILRTQVAKKSLITTINNPVFGVGLGNFIPAIYEGKFSDKIFTSSIERYQPVHNLLLLITSETGLFGGIIIFYVFLRSLKKARESKQVNFEMALIAIAITGMFDHYWFTLYQNKLLITIILALIWKVPSVHSQSA